LTSVQASGQTGPAVSVASKLANGRGLLDRKGRASNSWIHRYTRRAGVVT